MIKLKPIAILWNYRRHSLSEIESDVMRVAWKRLLDRQHHRMQDIASRAGVWNNFFPVQQLDDDITYAKKVAKTNAPCCITCRRKLV